MAGEWGGKVVRHRCGHVLWTRVVGSAEWAGQLVVEYRDGGGMGPVVYACPRCSKELKLWWLVPGSVSHCVDEMRSFVGGRGFESEVGL